MPHGIMFRFRATKLIIKFTYMQKKTLMIYKVYSNTLLQSILTSIKMSVLFQNKWGNTNLQLYHHHKSPAEHKKRCVLKYNNLKLQTPSTEGYKRLTWHLHCKVIKECSMLKHVTINPGWPGKLAISSHMLHLIAKGYRSFGNIWLQISH